MTHLGEARLLPKKNIWIAPPAGGDGYMGGGIIALLLKLVLFFCFPAPNHLSANMILLFVCFESRPAYLTMSCFRWQTFFIVCWLSVSYQPLGSWSHWQKIRKLLFKREKKWKCCLAFTRESNEAWEHRYMTDFDLHHSAASPPAYWWKW